MIQFALAIVLALVLAAPSFAQCLSCGVASTAVFRQRVVVASAPVFAVQAAPVVLAQPVVAQTVVQQPAVQQTVVQAAPVVAQSVIVPTVSFQATFVPAVAVQRVAVQRAVVQRTPIFQQRTVTRTRTVTR